ncbi:MAG: hypothetical protein IT530_08330 [Burkholderiales bacterium]|nr:hypothetical protein [Burkholderiales bacterium]
MIDRKRKLAGGRAIRKRGSKSVRWLGAEIELMIRERERLLHAAGAAASLFTALDIRDLPAEARGLLCRLGATLASLSDETLTDAMEHVLGGEHRLRMMAHS